LSEAPRSPGLLLADTLERTRRDEQRRALRALLATPLLLPDHPAFALARRHADYLRDWLGRETGWVLRVEPDFARLQKLPADHGDAYRAARPGRRPADLPFSRRRYALLCLALAELTRGQAQTTLGRLGETVMQAATDPALAATGLHFTLEGREQRKDLVAVVRLLLQLGVLSRVAGSEEAYIRTAEQDVLYDVQRRVLASLLIGSRGPSLVALEQPPPEDTDSRLQALSERLLPDTPEARNRALRQRLTARLLDDPILYWERLEADERAYLTGQRGAIVRRIEEATGLVAEVRAEGIAMVDPEGDLSDTRLPSEGTEGHATLLLAQHLAQHARRGGGKLPRPLLQEKLAQWATEYKRYWRKASREPGAEVGLCDTALKHLAALRLVRLVDDLVEPLPAIGRYRVEQPTITGSAP
jgi:uncharacterized protein (TIGR02678 family)